MVKVRIRGLSFTLGWTEFEHILSRSKVSIEILEVR